MQGPSDGAVVYDSLSNPLAYLRRTICYSQDLSESAGSLRAHILQGLSDGRTNFIVCTRDLQAAGLKENETFAYIGDRSLHLFYKTNYTIPPQFFDGYDLSEQHTLSVYRPNDARGICGHGGLDRCPHADCMGLGKHQSLARFSLFATRTAFRLVPAGDKLPPIRGTLPPKGGRTTPTGFHKIPGYPCATFGNPQGRPHPSSPK